MGIFKKKEAFKKIEATKAPVEDIEDFNKGYDESYEDGQLPELPSPKQKVVQEPVELTDDEIDTESENLRRRLEELKKEKEAKKRQEQLKPQKGINLTEALDIIQANTARNLDLLNYIRVNFGV